MTDPHAKHHKKSRRRAALRHAAFTALPVWLSGGWLARVRPGRDFTINGRLLDFPNLPDELCGLTIAHLSDPHIGKLITPAHLEHVVDAVNALNPDLIVATGDFIDFSNDYLPAVIKALTRLSAPLGLWSVLGNHDHLDDVRKLTSAFAEGGLNLLVNQTASLEHNGRRIALAGIDWAARDVDLARMVRQTAEQLPPSEFKLLLAHHPHAFDAACAAGFDLTLAGHTHGGQILLSDKRSKKGSIGLASLTNRYPRGLFLRGHHRLFVSSGVGSWFPLRFRCPAEITLLQLASSGMSPSWLPTDT